MGWARSAGVHSTVWIFAMRAALTRRAWSKRSSSDQEGYSARSRSQIALCSSVNSVCIISSPIHQFPFTPVISIPVSGSTGSKLLLQIVSLPSLPDRTLAWVCVSLPYNCEPSHQWVAVFKYVGGRFSELFERVGSACVRRIRIGCSGMDHPRQAVLPRGSFSDFSHG